MMIVFFHLLFLLEKYVCQKFFVREESEESVEPLALDKTTSSCGDNTTNSSNDQQLDKFYDDNDNDRTMKFSPPAYLQRYNAVCDILRSPQYRGKIHKVVDFGCSELGLFKHLKNISGIHELLCVDIDERILKMNIKNIQPLSADYLHMKDHPFNVHIYEGSVTHEDKNLENTDVIICIELIEHLYPETLSNVPENIFGFIQPRLAIFTTPNADFNVLFPNLKGFRHDDHKFEWTRSEFEYWANDIINKYQNYEVKFVGICPGPIGTEQFGCCTQMAIFTRRDDINYKTISGIDGLFKLISKIEYPFRVDNRPQEVKILDEASYFIHRYQLNGDCDDETMPLDYLTRVMDHLHITVESFRHILSNAGYHIVDDESRGPIIILPPSSIISGVTSEFDVTYDDFSHSSHPGEHENEVNSRENVNIDVSIDDIEHVTSQNSTEESILMKNYCDQVSIPHERDITKDYESIHSIFMESSKNENSLLDPGDITDPNFQFSIVSGNSSILMRNDDVSDESFTHDDDDDTNPQLTSTPNKKQSFALPNFGGYEVNHEKVFNHKTNLIVDVNMIENSLPGDIQTPMIMNRDTPSTSWSPEIISDSGYPNTCSPSDSTPEYDLPSIAQDSESDSESEHHDIEQQQNNIHDDEVENGDLANNNRDNEGSRSSCD